MVTVLTKGGVYKTNPVRIEEFLVSPRYVGKMLVWESVKEDLIALLSDKTPFNRGLLVEPPGAGKTTLGGLFLMWCLYLLANLRDPQGHFGLDQSTSIGVMNMSISSRTASGTLYSKLRKMLIASPWFQEYCRVDQSVQSEIRLPDPLFAFSGNSSESFPAGYDIFGAVVDEVTMFLNKSHKGAYSDQVKNIFEVLEERTESRFMGEGYVLAMGASSYTNDFVTEMEKEADEYGDILVIRRPLWYALPRTKFSGRYFLFDTDKMKIVPNSESEGLFTPENKQEIMEQIKAGLSIVPKPTVNRPAVSDTLSQKTGKQLMKITAV
ncbi:MAG TPA: hypothetical protein ENH85_06515 [Candidatus Scalindua sp.]|nr:hypothetical protein [Candidatus Scalindua sp.]